jgi:hypothetical protein
MSICIEGRDAENRREVYVAANSSSHRSSKIPSSLFNGSSAPASPILSSSEFLQRFHIHLSPNSLASSSLMPGSFVSSPEQHHNPSLFGSNASSRAFKLPLPMPAQPLPLPGENGDLDC